MQDKFTIEELVIKILPGGFFLAVIFFFFSNNTEINLNSDLDFLYTFLFFCVAFILGELLQTLAHEFEWIVDIFFKFRRPSKVFLYKENPVINSNHKRDELFQSLNLSKDEIKVFEKKYSDVPIFLKRNKKDDELSQSIFWKLYSKVSDLEEIKIANRNYLFVRVMLIEFLLLSVLFCWFAKINFAILSLVISIAFLWRARGVARGLVFKTVLLNLKK
ncbi:MAG: hypothetical protein GX926_03275 [Candidatus Magasanikbacteria bacterium]|nr:hypothetical protein [Candidatus Magasanikbacteria bacterium]